MTQPAWSALLQWSRLGVNAVLFLIVARYLSLTEIGAFATAFAPIRLLQVVHKNGIVDAYLVSDQSARTRNAFFALSIALGLIFSVTLAGVALILPDPVAPLLAGLCLVPLIFGVSAIAEATLRATLRIKALALRTLFAQLLAASLAFLALSAGWGAASLVVFALTNAVVIALVSLALARIRPTALPDGAAVRAVLPDIIRISARDLASNAVQPLLQLAVGAILGLAAGGAFQIAARVFSLLDALAIAPIRYIALPRFVALVGTAGLSQAVLKSLQRTSQIAAFIYFGALAAAPDLLGVAVGPDLARSTAPLLPAFCLLGLIGALAMPLNQSLTAIGQSRLTLRRSLATLILTALLAAPALTISTPALAATLPIAAGLVLLVYTRFALPILEVEPYRALLAIIPALLGGAVMAIGLTLADPLMHALTPALRLALKILLGGGIYAALLLAMHLPFRAVTP